MKWIVGCIMLAVLLTVLGIVPVKQFLSLALWAIDGLAGLCVLFFLVSVILILLSKRRQARFVRLERLDGEALFAIYESDGEELRNTFPTNRIFRKRLYRDGDRTIRVLRVRKSVWVCDRVSQIISVVGLAAFSALTVIVLAVQMM